VAVKRKNMQNQFTFTSGQRRALTVAMGIGVLCMVLTWMVDDAHHTRFWSNFLHNSVFFTGISFVSLFIICAFMTAYAGWSSVIRRVWEAYAQFLIVGLILMCVIAGGLWMKYHHLYHWADTGSVANDAVLKGKSSFLNKNWFTFGTLIIVGIWYFLFARKIRGLSLQEDQNPGTNYSVHRTMRKYAAAFLPVGGFTSAAMIWQWVMSVDAHWYSTMFAWYSTASFFVSAICLTVLTIIYLKSLGYMPYVTQEHLHDLGKYLFAFSVFWTYLWFSQYMLIWYGNVGEETVYFHTRRDQYSALFYGNILINFVLPFLVLLRNDTKRKVGTMVFVAIAVLFGHWIDFFQMIKPGVLHTAHELGGEHVAATANGAEGHHAAVSSFVSGFTLPGFLELGTFIGFLALFIYMAFHHMSKASLVPANDPYIEESYAHHVM
jgi:hypothetical protein